MPIVNFTQFDGQQSELTIQAGTSLMEGAIMAGVDGIDADCGGQLSCATCHVKIDPQWQGKLPEACIDELEMLEFAVDLGEGSRLSCQIIVSDEMDGLTVHVPESQK